MGRQPARRPGGRSARVRASTHRAVLDLLMEHDWAALSIPMVAERSGVHPATLYRRWGTLQALIGEAVVEWMATASPMPDTGSLRGDLEVYASRVADDLAGPSGPLLLRAALLAGDPGGSGRPGPGGYLGGRSAQIQAMLDRAAARGEPAPALRDVFEMVLAPLYGYALLTGYAADIARGRRALVLVDRLLALSRLDIPTPDPAE